MQCTTAFFGGLKEATRFRERWRFRAREISHTLPVRHADEVTRLGGHSRDEPEEQDDSGLVAAFEEVSNRYGAWLDSQGLRTRRTAMRASSPKAVEVEECVWEPFVVSVRHGTTPLVGTRSSKATSSLRKLFT